MTAAEYLKVVSIEWLPLQTTLSGVGSHDLEALVHAKSGLTNQETLLFSCFIATLPKDMVWWLDHHVSTSIQA